MKYIHIQEIAFSIDSSDQLVAERVVERFNNKLVSTSKDNQISMLAKNRSRKSETKAAVKANQKIIEGRSSGKRVLTFESKKIGSLQ